jgi:F0F1-type ATP synthase delta subunit
MKITPELVARSLVETCKGLSGDCATAADAALELLRIHGLSKHIRTFPRLVRAELRRQGMLTGVLKTPTGQAEGLESQLTELLSKTLGKHVELALIKDSSLIGGAILQVGDERFDASVAGALMRLRSHLTAQAA